MPPDLQLPEIRAYLLGTLGEERRDALELAYFADSELADEVRGAEEALIDEYLAGALPAGEREAFERHYLASPVHRDRVATARTLTARATPTVEPGVVDIREARQRPPRVWFPLNWLVLAAAAMLATFVVLWFTAGTTTTPPRQAQAPAGPPSNLPGPPRTPPGPDAGSSATPADPGTPPQNSPSPEPRRGLLAITLSPIVTRGDRQKTEHLPDGPTDLLLQLEGTPEPTDRSYMVELQSVDGVVVWQGRARPSEPSSGRLTSVRVPADRLEPDDYVVAIFAPAGSERVERGRYVLRLARR